MSRGQVDLGELVTQVVHDTGPPAANKVEVLAVRNGGAPIPPELIDKLFDPYTRSTRSVGAGLGLYIVKQIARAHGGTVTVSSNAEATAFTVTLPIAPPAS